MSENKNVPQQGGYGFDDSEGPDSSSFVFGLNSGNVFLTKFEFTANGGKDGAEANAMEIVFTVDGKERSARKFEVTKAYAKDDAGAQIEVTDPAHPAMNQAKAEMSSFLIHILGVFVEKAQIKSALEAQPIQGFKHYCTVLQGLLPANFATVKLDAFAQYQWNIKGENKRTFLEFPKNMKHGRWLSKHVEPVGGTWEKQQKPNASDSETALRYVDADGNVHPFVRNGWYMTSNFATMQKEEASVGASQMNAGTSTTETSGGGGW